MLRGSGTVVVFADLGRGGCVCRAGDGGADSQERGGGGTTPPSSGPDQLPPPLPPVRETPRSQFAVWRPTVPRTRGCVDRGAVGGACAGALCPVNSMHFHMKSFRGDRAGPIRLWWSPCCARATAQASSRGGQGGIGATTPHVTQLYVTLWEGASFATRFAANPCLGQVLAPSLFSTLLWTGGGGGGLRWNTAALHFGQGWRELAAGMARYSPTAVEPAFYCWEYSWEVATSPLPY